MSRSSNVLKFRSPIRKYVKQSMILLIIISSGLFLNFTTSNDNNFEIADVRIDSNKRFDFNGKSNSNSKLSTVKDPQNQYHQNKEFQKSLRTLDLSTPNGVILATESITDPSSSNIPFRYNETLTNSTNFELVNNEPFVVIPVEANTLSEFSGNITTSTNTEQYEIEDQTDTDSTDYGGNRAYAQAVNITFLDGSTVALISSFYVNAQFALTGDVYIGEIWTSINNGTHIVPNIVVESKTITLGTSLVGQNMTFLFDSPAIVSANDVHKDGSNSGYIFFVIYRGTSGSSAAIHIDNEDGSSDAITYSFVGTGSEQLPANNNSWTGESYDLQMSYNASFEIDPTLIDTTVNLDADSTQITVSADGVFTDSTERIGNSTYYVNYNTTKSDNFGISPIINMNYTSFVNFQNNTIATYSVTPNDPNIMWDIQFVSPYLDSSNGIIKNLVLPGSFNNIEVYHNAVKLDLDPLNYTISSDSNGNQLAFINVGIGIYKILANSTNLLSSVNIRSYVNNSGWQEQNNATMGTLFPSFSDGDLVKSNITDNLLNDLFNGNYNASLRDEFGTILNSNFTEEFLFINSMSFNMTLEPNIPTGFWSFQFRWFNGTAAGAIALEFIILPSGTLELRQPTSLTSDIVETETINIEVATLDNSHNGPWPTTGILSWELNNNIPMTNEGSNGSHFIYTHDINTAIGSNPVKKKSYTFTISFTDGPFTISTDFVITIFYRADTQVSLEEPVEFFDPLELIFAPLNMTGDQQEFNATGINFNITSLPSQTSLPFSVIYDPTPGRYNISIFWSDLFFFGSGNDIQLNWTLDGFKSDIIAEYSLSFIPYMFNFKTGDSSFPQFNLTPSSIITVNESTTGNLLSWNATDSNPAQYLYQIKTVIGDNLVVNSTLTVWDNNTIMSVNVDNLNPGVYFVNLTIFDESGNAIFDVVTVTVNDVDIPNIVIPANNKSVAEGQITETLNWNVTDKHHQNYEIFRNNTSVVNGTWSNNTLIIHNINTSLTIGMYNFTLMVYDETGNSASQTAWVTVIDETLPNLPDVPNNSYEEFTLGNQITWNPTDTNPQNYTIYRNNNSILNSTWTSNVPILFTVDNLLLGEHNFTIIVFDTSGNFVTDTVLITVQDTTPPEVTKPEDITYTGGDQNNELSWNMSDAHLDSYTIYLNKVINTSAVWTSNLVTIDIDGLAIGIHNFTIQITDTSGNNVSDTVFITVLDPNITYTQFVPFDITKNLYEGDVETLSILGWATVNDLNVTGGRLNATLIAIEVDEKTLGDLIFQTSFISANDIFDIILDYSNLLNGTYQWIFTFEKLDFETQIVPSSLFEVIIFPHTLKIEISTGSTLVKNEEFFISANVTYANSRNSNLLYLNSISGREKAEGIPISFEITIISDAGTEITYIKQGTTNAEGVVRVRLNSVETENLKEILSITANIEELVGYTGSFSEIRTDFTIKIEESIEGSEFVGLLGEIYNLILNQIITVIGVLIAILVVLIYFWSRLRKRRTKFTKYTKESEDATAEIDGLRSMHGIIMTAGATGIPFYEYTFTSARTTIDSALISGITTALSMFLNELNEEVLGFEHMERAGVSITSHKSDLSTIMIISDAPLPPIILEQLKNGHHAIENKFSKQLMIPERMMDIEPINITNELISKSLKLNLKEDVIIRINNLKNLQKRKSISRKIRNDMGMLKKLSKLSDETIEPLNLELILAYLESNGIDHATACRIIYLTYANFIIVPI